MHEFVTIIIGLFSGLAGAIGGAWIARSCFSAGIQHLLAISLQKRETVGTSDLEFRKQQLSELYGPIYAYAKLNQQLYRIWMAGELKDINREIIALFRQQNERIVEILSTKIHLLEGGTLPPGFTQFMTAVTLWNIYTARPDQPWIPKSVEALPEAKYPEEFEKYIFETTEHLKKRIEHLHQKYGIS